MACMHSGFVAAPSPRLPQRWEAIGFESLLAFLTVRDVTMSVYVYGHILNDIEVRSIISNWP